MRRIVYLIIYLFSLSISSQELNCLITINDDQIPGSNKQIFRTLEKTISEFINQKKWTNKEVKAEERINCAMNIIITKWDNNNSQFEGTIQVQSTRPVYGTSYESSVLNIRDTEFNFRYNEFDQFIFNPTTYDSNLVSMLAFYVYVIIGVDADTFKVKGGEPYLKQAENAMLQAQQSGISAWANEVGKTNRFQLIDNLLSPNMVRFRNILYNYHRKGLDEMASDKLKAKQTIENNIIALDQLFNKVIGNPMIRLFFDAKSDEIVNLYSDGPTTRSYQRMLAVVQKISPNNSNKWKKIN